MPCFSCGRTAGGQLPKQRSAVVPGRLCPGMRKGSTIDHLSQKIENKTSPAGLPCLVGVIVELASVGPGTLGAQVELLHPAERRAGASRPMAAWTHAGVGCGSRAKGVASA